MSIVRSLIWLFDHNEERKRKEDEKRWQQQLDPGTYSFEARAGERHVRKVVTLKRGEQQRVALVLPPPAEDRPVVIPPADDSGRSVRIAGWTAVGLGGAGLSGQNRPGQSVSALSSSRHDLT